jgi:WD40 repeat protein
MRKVQADGKSVVFGGTGGVDNAVRIADPSTGKEISSFELNLKEWETPIRLALSPDGKMLAAVYRDLHEYGRNKINGGVVFWDAATGKELGRVDCGSLPGDLAFSPDSKVFVTVDSERRMHVRDATTGKKLHDFKDHDGGAGVPTFSADGKLMAFFSCTRSPTVAAQSEGQVFLYDTTNWRGVRRLVPNPPDKNGSLLTCSSVVFSPDLKLLVGSDGEKIYFWEIETDKPVEAVPASRADRGATDRVTSMSISHDGKMLAVAWDAGRATIWDVAARQRLHTLAAEPGWTPLSSDPSSTSLAVFSPGAPAVLATNGGPALRFWDPVTGKERQLSDAPSAGVNLACFVPEGKVLSVAYTENGYRLWDARTAKQLTRVPTGARYIGSAVASPDGKLLAVSYWHGFQGEADRAIHLFDVLAGKEIRQFTAEGGVYGSSPIGITSDGRFLFALEVPNRVAIWDTATGKVTRRLDLGKELPVNRAVLSADGKSLALEVHKPGPPPGPGVFDAGGRIPRHVPYCCILDVASGSPRWCSKLEDPSEDTDSLAFSPDGKLLAQGTPGKIRLRDSATGAVLHELNTRTKGERAFARQPGALAFTPDGKKLIAADDRTNVFVWDVATGKELRKFVAHRGRVFSISTSPDGTMFATSSEDSTVMLWRLEGP